ncbi:hypothetical protein [Actinopolyspora mortivallis]|uniref:hypothetical protein n=1 Tax=Actinopolyspora mortivallis TaxID=33906 RepID=UPI00036851DA|nr:hypothetical protein [Actinopolyspora mortivallis]
MPIRTHRGRAAVYRRLWGWPLRSPKHLVAAIVLVVATVSGVGFLLPGPLPGAGAGGSGGESVRDYERYSRDDAVDNDTGPSDSGFQGAPPSISVPTARPESVPADPAGLDVVRQWVTRWSRTSEDTTRQQWLDGLRPYTTSEFIGVMNTVDPANVPATEITGELRVDESTETSMRVRVPTDGPTLRVHVVRSEQGWRVSGYDRVD